MRRVAISLIALACLSLPVAYGQSAEKPKVKAEHPSITMKQARQTAAERVPGEIKSSELERENRLLIYSFDIQTEKGIREVQVDANTGKIVADEMESPAQAAKEAAQDHAAHKKAESKKTTDPK